jgi:hypothetical protein
MSDDARLATWQSMQRFPDIVALVRKDPDFAALLAALCERFGALTVEPVEDALSLVVPSLEIELVGKRGRGR